MNFGGQNQEAKVGDSWIPKTPFKPILPNPSLIYTDRQGNQLNQVNWLRSDGNPLNFTHETHVQGESICLDASSCRWETGCTKFSINGSGSQWNGMPFASLLALANASSVTWSGATSRGNEGFSLGSNQWIHGNFTPGAQYESPVPSRSMLDINFPIPAMRTTEVLSGNSVQFAPATPDKAVRPECRQVAELRSDKGSQGNNEQGSGINATENQANTELRKPPEDSLSFSVEIGNSNPEKGINNVDVFTKTPQQKPVRRKHRPKVITEGKHRTPRTVTPKPGTSKENTTVKEKHVQRNVADKASETSTAEFCQESTDYIAEPAAYQGNTKGKRNYTRKKAVKEASATPPAAPGGEATNPAANQETSKGKRKYTRRSDQKKVSVTHPAVATKEATNEETDEPTKKSCRRVLNFDMEEQQRDESSKCKWSSNLKTEAPTNDSIGGQQSKSIVELGQGIEVVVEPTASGIANDFRQSLKQMLKDCMSLSNKPGPTTPAPSKILSPCEEQDISDQGNFIESIQKTAQSREGNYTEKTQLYSNSQGSIRSTNDINFINGPSQTEEEQASRSKRKHANPIGQLEAGSTSIIGIQYNALDAYLAVFPTFDKKTRTEKGYDPITSSTSCMAGTGDAIRLNTEGPTIDLGGNPCISKDNHQIVLPNCHVSALPDTATEAGRLQYNLHNFESILAQTERSTKRRSRFPTRVRSLASLTAMASCMMQATHQSTQAQADCNWQQEGNSQRPYTCLEALVAEKCTTLTTKKRTKKRLSLVNSNLSGSNKEQSHGKLILYNQNQLSMNALGASTEIWKQMSFVDAIAEQLKYLDINRESSQVAYKMHGELVPYGSGHEIQNAIALYRRDGTIVPFDGPFQPVKRRPPRAKVDLDAETDRVWRLLLKDINSKGIDGTDEEKAKWWEEERNIFRGRADSFIARMHLVQGDRRFSPWKGSVVDSVVGVFLTQNVSDHLSSSAFMSLAAHFPLNSKDKHTECTEEKRSSVVDEPVEYIPGQQDLIKWNEISDQSTCDQISVTLRDSDAEEREVVNSNASSGSSRHTVTCESIQKKSTIEATETEKDHMGDKRLENDVHSLQNSVVSSQNSMDSPIFPIDAGKELFSGTYLGSEDLTNGSRLKSFSGCGSFVELLEKAGSSTPHEFGSQGNGDAPSENHPKDETSRQQSGQNDLQKPKMDDSDSSKCPIEASIESSYCHRLLELNSGVAQLDCSEVNIAEARYSDISNNGKSKMENLSAHTADSANHATMDKEAPRSPDTNLSSNCVIEDRHTTMNSENGLIEDPKIIGKSQEQAQKIELHRSFSFTNNSGEALVTIENNSEVDKQEKDLQKELIARRKEKSRRVGDEIRDDIDWEAFRKEVLAYGEKRERTQNTMDSVDWEAVRCADVNEVADTIKERGMNNVLAGRIKDFLDRLVTEHGSIDLEWLRDVPPDKAKKYLLTFRGLGLKSVECVRLLTLHHLAFPVDTNVGRIAVRLGWVPLQPLPESLQLHLLELYPVLESIQKYLWPRLCKLDQKTLYELHYQLITFGKVFCTKNKPNCNACPMRGECRHFASAFASARLALPGPEENRIVGVNQTRTNDQNPTVDRVHLALPEVAEDPLENQQQIARQSEANFGARNREPIVEEPLSPEPERQVTMNDIEDTLCEDPDEIPTIKLNMEVFTQNLQNYMQQNMELQERDMSKALVTLTAEAASIPTPKLKNVSRLRTEHQVYELPDSHPLVEELDVRELDDPSPYLLAIWTPGETADSIQPPASRCSAQEYGKLCDDETCFSCNSTREANSQIVRGTLLIPCRTAMRGSFPLNGTYFQVNEVFADHDSSLNPIDVPRSWIWNLPRRTVYFGTSIPNIFKGLTTEEIQHCFWRGFVCVRGFDQKTRAPRPLMARLHFPASKLKTKGNTADEM